MQELQINNLSKNNIGNNQHFQNLFSWEIEVLLEEFLATKKSLNTRKSYSQDLLSFFNKYQIFFVKDFIEKSISWEIWNYIWDFLENFKKTDKQNKNRILNPRTVNRKLFSLSSFFKFLNKKYDFKYNPTKVFSALKTWKHSSTDSLQEWEIFELLKKMKESFLMSENDLQKILRLRDYLIFIFLSFSLRRNEIANLKWQDLKSQSWQNWVQNFLEVYQKWWDLKQIPVPDWVFRYLQILRNLKNSNWFLTEFIFSPTRNNKTWDLDKPLASDMIYSLVEKNYQKFFKQKNFSDEQKIFSEQLKNLQKDLEKFRKIKYRAKKNISIYCSSKVWNTEVNVFSEEKYLKKISENNKKFSEAEKNISEISEKIKKIKFEQKNLFWTKKITPHSFRKTFVETMIQKNVNFTNIMNATWHANVQMIDYYQSLNKVENNAINEINLDY